MSPADLAALALAVVFGLGGLQQLAGAAPMRAMAERLEIDYRVFSLVGIAQSLGAIGLVAGVVVDTWIGVAAAWGLALLAVLGMGAHFRAREPWLAYLPALTLGSAAIAVALTL